MHCNDHRLSGSADFEMEVDLEEDNVNDDMAWCDPSEMSPRSELKSTNRRNGPHRHHNHNRNKSVPSKSNRNPFITDHEDDDEDVMIIGDNLDVIRSRRMQKDGNGLNLKQEDNPKVTQLHVMSMECLGQMPPLERPSDL